MKTEYMYGAAFDIGTTTVVARLYDLQERRQLMELSDRNPQRNYGADIIGRMQFALKKKENAAFLQEKILQCMAQMLEIFRQKTGVPVSFITAAGNSAMTHLLLSEPVETLAKKPFLPAFKEGQYREWHQDKEHIILKKRERNMPFLYTLPLLEGQIGGDTSAALLASDRYSMGNGTLLLDLGTNGEIVFYWNSRLYACSTAAGPALEGAGISCGMRAEPGAIASVWLNGGEIYVKTVGNTEPKGICGTGLIDAAAVLLDIGKLHKDGYLEDGRLIFPESDICLTQDDIHAFLMAKAAIRAGISAVLGCAGAKSKDIQYILAAGAFGSHLNIQNAIRIGLFPEAGTVKFLGNAALDGAGMVLLDQKKKEEIKRFREKLVYVNLAEDPVFREEYIRQMMF